MFIYTLRNGITLALLHYNSFSDFFYIAKAIAGEAGVPFFYRAGSEFEEMWVSTFYSGDSLIVSTLSDNTLAYL